MLELADVGHPVRLASVAPPDRDPRFVAEPGRAGRGSRTPTRFARQWHILMKGCIVAAGEGDQQAAARARELGVLLLAHRGVAVQPAG